MDIHSHGKVEFHENEFLWRYLSHQKLLSFLNEKKLRFTRLDKFSDPLEGLTEDVIGRLAEYETLPKTVAEVNFNIPLEARQKIITDQENRKKYVQEKTKKSQETQFANCWFVGAKESFAMWNQYSNSDGVVIRYNPNEFLKLVIASAEGYKSDVFKKFLYGRIHYKDIWPFNFFKSDGINVEFNAFKKDLSYEHEKEFRFIVVIPSNLTVRPEYFELPLGDITNDNFKILANPFMEEWKYKNLKEILKSHALDGKLEKSILKIKQK